MLPKAIVHFIQGPHNQRELSQKDTMKAAIREYDEFLIMLKK